MEIKEKASNLVSVKSGAHQGGIILGPLLFLVYVNDIPSVCSPSSTFLFANGTKSPSTLPQTKNVIRKT